MKNNIEKGRKEDNSDLMVICTNCGKMGHKALNCRNLPLENELIKKWHNPDEKLNPGCDICGGAHKTSQHDEYGRQNDKIGLAN